MCYKHGGLTKRMLSKHWQWVCTARALAIAGRLGSAYLGLVHLGQLFIFFAHFWPGLSNAHVSIACRSAGTERGTLTCVAADFEFEMAQ